MTEKIVDAYTISPDDIQPGDVMMFTVKAMVMQGQDGELLYRLYSCRFFTVGLDVDHLPQGTRIESEQAVARALFPSLVRVAKPDGRY